MFKNKKNCFFKHNIHLIIGKEKSGKTFLIKDILYHHQFIPEGLIISNIEKENEYEEMMSNEFIKSKYDKEITINFMKRQKNKRKYIIKKQELEYEKKRLNKLNKINNEKKENEEKQEKEEKEEDIILDNNSFLIFDNSIKKDDFIKDKVIRQIYMNGRTWSVFNIISTSEIIKIPPNLRACCDFVFIFKEEIEKNKKKIYENYVEMILTYNMFEKIIDSLNEYECIVLNYSTPSQKIEDNMFWYKAESHENFKLSLEENYEKNDNKMKEFGII